MPKLITDQDLVIHVLNVGFGDSIVIEFPREEDGSKCVGIVDCYKGQKTIDYLKKINGIRPFTEVSFVCATHPHADHVAGIKMILEQDDLKPTEFWDSGFRHQSVTYRRILETVRDQNVRMLRVSSGMEWYFGNVRITALAPSISLRNRYATYGIDINNASIVLRLEYCKDNVLTIESMRYIGKRDPEKERKGGKAVAILGADAEFHSWAKISEEFPNLHKTATNQPLVNKVVNLLNCDFLKVSHHGSMHSAPLDILEQLAPQIAGVSNKQKIGSKGGVERSLFPHALNVLSLEEVGARIMTTDGQLEEEAPGSIAVAFSAGGRARAGRLNDGVSDVPEPPVEL